MKVLVFGWGSAGKRHVEDLKAAVGAEVGCCDPARGGLGDDAVRWFMDEALAWEWRPDAAVVASPASTHARLFWDALVRCGAVLVEKPLALSVADVTRADPKARVPSTWPTVVAASDRVVQVGYQLRFHEAARVLKEAVDGGAVGVPLSGRFITASDLATWPGQHYADALLECSHEVDAALWVLGDAYVTGAACEGRTWELRLTHDRGPRRALSTVHLSTESPVYRREWMVIGRDGVVAWRWGRGEVELTRHDGSSVVLWRGDSDEFNRSAYRAQAEAFLAAARGGPASGCSLADALRVLQVTDAARALALSAI